ncbi:MAG TPA: AarF/UbiB family protein [Verrucomicrobiae bacterium]
MLFKTKNLPRYKEIVMLLWRHGRSDVFRTLAKIGEIRDEEVLTTDNQPAPEELARDLEKMGPTFVKLGQVLSSRADLLPEPYLKALSRLQDNVKPFPYAEVEEIVQQELGVRLSKAFREFSQEPLAAASLGQVHKAVLRDGRPVVVKVQRPNIRKQIAEDLEVMEEMASFLDDHTEVGKRHHFCEVLEQFRKTLVLELDYEHEASNMTVFAENLREFPHIITPLPIAGYTTRAVLTMTYIHGQKITEISPLLRLDFDGQALADELFKAYLKQVLVDGVFHADPHPGNVLLTDNMRVALLDLGMVDHVMPRMQESLIKLLLAISEGRSEDAASVAIEISRTRDDFDEAAFTRRLGSLVAEMQDNNLRQLDPGRSLLEITRVAGETGLHVPSELTLLGKTLLQLHQIGKSLEPDFNPNAAIRDHVHTILNQRVKKDFTTGNVFAAMLEVKDFARQLPTRLNKVLDAVGKGEIELKLRNDDTLYILDGLQKIANRIAAGLVLAALIIGAALLMQVKTKFELFGYPGLAILCFFGAAAGGVFLLFEIFFRDTKRPPSNK